jgi:endonuclease V-like protein UPF0215 family
MPVGRISHVVGFDDAPFPPETRGDVVVVGAVFCDRRLEGVLRGKVRRDGANATRELVRMVQESRFAPHLQAVLLQGIALGGFNVVDVRGLHRLLGLPVLVVSRRAPDLPAIERALLRRVSGGARKWRLVQRAGPSEAIAGVYVQRVGIEAAQATELIRRLALNSAVPEPLRSAHLIAGAMVPGGGRHRV